MTRKRFIKLVMSRGISRNTAQAYADLVVRSGNRSYQEVWDTILTPDWSYLCSTIQDCVQRFVMVVGEMAESLGEALVVWGRSITGGNENGE